MAKKMTFDGADLGKIENIHERQKREREKELREKERRGALWLVLVDPRILTPIGFGVMMFVAYMVVHFCPPIHGGAFFPPEVEVPQCRQQPSTEVVQTTGSMVVDVKKLTKLDSSLNFESMMPNVMTQAFTEFRSEAKDNFGTSSDEEVFVYMQNFWNGVLLQKDMFISELNQDIGKCVGEVLAHAHGCTSNVCTNMILASKELLYVNTNVPESENELYLSLKGIARDMIWSTRLFWLWAKLFFLKSWIEWCIRFIVGAIWTVLGGGCLLYFNLVPTVNEFFVNGQMGANNMTQLNILRNVMLPKHKLRFFVVCAVIFVVTAFGWTTFDEQDTLSSYQTEIVDRVSQHQIDLNKFLTDIPEVFDFVENVRSAKTDATLFKVFANLKIQDDNQNSRFQHFYEKLSGGSACKGSIVVQTLNSTKMNYNLDPSGPLESSSRKLFYIVDKALRMYQRLDVIKSLCQVHRDRDSNVEDKTKIFQTKLHTICSQVDTYPSAFDLTFVENVAKMLHWHIISKGQFNTDDFQKFLSVSKEARNNKILENAAKTCATAVKDKRKSSPNMLQSKFASLIEL